MVSGTHPFSADVDDETQRKTMEWKRTLSATVEDVESMQKLLGGAMIAYREKLHAHAVSCKRLRELSENAANVVHFNVGGQFFTVSHATIEKFPDSLLYRIVRAPNTYRDSRNHILIDRDNEIFGHILNCMRGYRPQVTTHETEAFLEDLTYYGLGNIRQDLSEPQPNPQNLFHAGNSMQTGTFRSSYCVGVVGDRPFVEGKHVQTFSIDQCEYVGIGVVSDFCTALDQEFHKTPHCCVYYMTGVFYANFPIHTKEEGLERFTHGDRIAIELHMDEKLIKFSKNGRVVRIIACRPANRLRFATIMKYNSIVTLRDA